MVSKVFKLDECVLAVPLHHGLHELVYKTVVRLTRHPLMTVADVKLILQQFLRWMKVVG